MGTLSIPSADVHRLLTDSARGSATSYQRAFTDIAATHHGRPAAEILPLLRAAADVALLGFTRADLEDQAAAISHGARYELRVRITDR
ncbi:hypothetical protein ACFVU3_14765 [Streptomyces sp. NPDC058052]|uniref:hypothetical protein n=1 Tax=Streptomyces sp. NPDC058052 TaxID=3346316 RepID=UPI0036E7766E